MKSFCKLQILLSFETTVGLKKYKIAIVQVEVEKSALATKVIARADFNFLPPNVGVLLLVYKGSVREECAGLKAKIIAARAALG